MNFICYNASWTVLVLLIMRRIEKYLLSNVSANPWTSQNGFPSFHPCCRDAVKFTGTPNTAMMSSAKIIFINRVVNWSWSLKGVRNICLEIRSDNVVRILLELNYHWFWKSYRRVLHINIDYDKIAKNSKTRGKSEHHCQCCPRPNWQIRTCAEVSILWNIDKFKLFNS